MLPDATTGSSGAALGGAAWLCLKRSPPLYTKHGPVDADLVYNLGFGQGPEPAQSRVGTLRSWDTPNARMQLPMTDRTEGAAPRNSQT